MPDNYDTPSLTLSHEELMFLLRVLRAPGLMGLDDVELNQERLAASMVCAERSLRAKNLLRVLEDEKRIEIAPVVLALLGNCLIPAYSILVTSTNKHARQGGVYFHVTAQLTVENYSPESGLYQFCGYKDIEDVVPKIEHILGLTDQLAPSTRKGRIEEKLLHQARDAIRNGKAADAMDILESGCRDADLSRELVDTLENPINSGSVIRFDFDTDRMKTSGFSFLEGPDGFWVFTPEKGSTPLTVRIEPLSAQEIKRCIFSLIKM